MKQNTRYILNITLYKIGQTFYVCYFRIQTLVRTCMATTTVTALETLLEKVYINLFFFFFLKALLKFQSKSDLVYFDSYVPKIGSHC